jgi:subtilisin family serine protease
MRFLHTLALVPIVLTVGCASHGKPLERDATPTAVAKIDSSVLAAMDTARQLPVLVLGHTQLLERLHGLEEFAAKNDKADRRALRPEVIATLKRIAEPEQRRILKSLGKQRAERSLWIANVMALTLTPDEIRRAAALRDVEFIYPSIEPIPEPEQSGNIALLSAAAARPPFVAEGKRVAWNVERLGAPRVWQELGERGEGALVAVIDNGANYLQHNLRGNIWRNAREIPNNGVDDDHNGYVDDVYGYDFANMRADVRDTSSKVQHGTWTSGIIAGDGTDGVITGVAPRTTLMELVSGFGPTATGLAFQYALEQGADVVSMSFSVPNLGNLRGLWRMMCEHAVAGGAVLVGGAGNFQQSAKLPYQIQSPKDIPSVIAVGGVDTALAVMPYSSLGPVEWGTVALYRDFPLPAGLTKPDIVAFPGPNYPVLAVVDSGYIDPNPRIQGNSFSGPQAAGVAALMLSAAPSLPSWRVKALLERTARDLDTPGRDNRTGAGLIDAYRAVSEAVKSCGRCATRYKSGTGQGLSMRDDPAPDTLQIQRAPSQPHARR